MRPHGLHHFKINKGKLQRLRGAIIEQPGVAGLSIVMPLQAAAYAVGLFFAHADIKQARPIKRVHDVAGRERDEIQADDAAKRPDIKRLEPIAFFKIDLNLTHEKIFLLALFLLIRSATPRHNPPFSALSAKLNTAKSAPLPGALFAVSKIFYTISL